MKSLRLILAFQVFMARSEFLGESPSREVMNEGAEKPSAGR